jgi:hypothetical protein
MRSLRVFGTMLTIVAAAGIVIAQEQVAKPPEQSAKPPEPARTAPYVSTANVQIELSIADYLGSAAPQRKTVSMLIAEGYMGRVRSQRGGAAVLNVDATPRLQKDGRIALQLIVEYRPRETADTLESYSPINEMLTVLLHSGKPLVVTQAADPSSDRKVTVEVTATILK